MDGLEAHTARGEILFTVVLLIALAVVWYLRDLVLLVYASVLFAILISPLVERVERQQILGRRVGRGLAMAAVLAGGLAALGLILLVVLPPILNQASGLIAVGPRLAQQLLTWLQTTPGLHDFNLSQLESHLGEAGGWALVAAQHLVSGLADLFTILLLTVYFVADGHRARSWCLSFLCDEPQRRLGLALDRGARRMRCWLLGQSALALLLGCTSALVYGFLRVPDFYVLALLTALLSFVPILGPITAVTITGVVAGISGWSKLAGVLIFFGLYQIADNGYLTPRVMQDAVDVPGLAIILALAVGASLGGVLGAALAVPSAALAAELLDEYRRAEA